MITTLGTTYTPTTEDGFHAYIKGIGGIYVFETYATVNRQGARPFNLTIPERFRTTATRRIRWAHRAAMSF